MNPTGVEQAYGIHVLIKEGGSMIPVFIAEGMNLGAYPLAGKISSPFPGFFGCWSQGLRAWAGLK
jgi:hypothetical protein